MGGESAEEEGGQPVAWPRIHLNDFAVLANRGDTLMQGDTVLLAQEWVVAVPAVDPGRLHLSSSSSSSREPVKFTAHKSIETLGTST